MSRGHKYIHGNHHVASYGIVALGSPWRSVCSKSEGKTPTTSVFTLAGIQAVDNKVGYQGGLLLAKKWGASTNCMELSCAVVERGVT